MTHLRRLTVLFMLAVVFLIPSVRAQAASSAELQARIAALMAQIAALQGTTANAPATTYLTLSPDEGFGPLEVVANISVDMGTTTCGATTLGYLDWDNGKTEKKVTAYNTGCERVKKGMLTYVYDSAGIFFPHFESVKGNDADGRVEVLVDDSPIVEGISTSAYVSESMPNIATYTIKYDVTAVDGDLFIADKAKNSTSEDAMAAGYVFEGSPAVNGAYASVLQSTADMVSGTGNSGKYYVVEEGDTESFILTVTLNSNVTGNYKMRLTRVGYSYSKKAPVDYVDLGSSDPDFVTKAVKVTKGVVTDTTLNTHTAYVNGGQVLQTKNIKESIALASCKTLATRYSKDNVRCTWGTKEIFNNGVTPVKSATLNTKSLKSSTEYPTISGTATGISTIGISIGNGDKVYGSGNLVVANGKWSVKVDTALRDGTYTVYVYSDNVELTRGTLVVKKVATTPVPPTPPTSEDAYAKTMPVIIGVYEGTYPAGVKVEKHKTVGTVTVNIEGEASAAAQPLVLTAYEPVNWVINNPNNVKLTKIVAVGVYSQKVTNAPAGVPVEYYSKEAGTDYQYAYVARDALHDKLLVWLNRKFQWGDSGVFYMKQVGDVINAYISYKG